MTNALAVLKKYSAALLPFMLFTVPLVAFGDCNSETQLCNPLGFDSLTEFLRKILELVVMIGFPAIVLFIVYIGFQFIASEGNPEKLSKVRRLFFWALVGALLVLGAEALSIAIQGTVEQLKGGVN